MRRVPFRAATAIATLVALAGGCSRHPAEPPTTAAHAPAAAATPEATDAPSAQTVHGLRKQKNLDVPVFVDGTEVAVPALRRASASGVDRIARPDDPDQRARPVLPHHRLPEGHRASTSTASGRCTSPDKGMRIGSFIEGREPGREGSLRLRLPPDEDRHAHADVVDGRAQERAPDRRHPGRERLRPEGTDDHRSPLPLLPRGRRLRPSRGSRRAT